MDQNKRLKIIKDTIDEANQKTDEKIHPIESVSEVEQRYLTRGIEKQKYVDKLIKLYSNKACDLNVEYNEKTEEMYEKEFRERLEMYDRYRNTGFGYIGSYQTPEGPAIGLIKPLHIPLGEKN